MIRRTHDPEQDDVLAYYETGIEAERLARGEGALELTRTKELILGYLPPATSIVDVGGGTGVYASWLAGEGHRVELVEPEPVREHIDRARRRAGLPPRFGVHLGDARALPFADDAFDAVLLLGPLYHLGDRDDRLAAIREATRVCKSRGLVFAAAISRYAGLLRALRDGTIGDRSVFDNVRDEVRSGRRVPRARRNSTFPDAYFHLPDQLRAELEAAGAVVEAIHGIEGPGILLPDLEARWEEGATRESLLSLARDADTDPLLVPLSAHLLAVARTA